MDHTERVQPLDDHEWAYRKPPALMPVPAASVAQPLTGQRVVMYSPVGQLWRYDVRAVSEPHRYRDRWCVGLLPEGDWYRRQREPERSGAMVPYPYPLDWVWIEQPVDANDFPEPELVDQQDVGATMGFARHLVGEASAPPVRYLRPALAESTVPSGARACVMGQEGPEWGLRVCGSPRLEEFSRAVDLSGGLDELDHAPIGPKVPLCWENQWYEWEQTGVVPNATHCWLVPVWLE